VKSIWSEDDLLLDDMDYSEIPSKSEVDADIKERVVHAPPQLADLASKRKDQWYLGMTNEFKKSIKKVDKKIKGRILEAIRQLSENPTKKKGNTIKPLTAELKGLWRYRVGDYRIFYRPNTKERQVMLLMFSARSGAYD
jgi:mRNA interferase RelE/StbE